MAWAEVQKSEAEEKTKAQAGANQDGAGDSFRRKKTDECQSWLEAVSKWEAYVLDARFGMRVNTGMDTLKWYRRHHKWASA